MKMDAIKVGMVYFDGKMGLREVVSIDPDTHVLTYRLMMSKTPKEWNEQRHQWATRIGATYQMKRGYFAEWAKAEYSMDMAKEVQLLLSTKRLKISQNEAAYMRSLCRGIGDTAKPGAAIEVKPTERRAAVHLATKGLLEQEEGATNLTELGAAYWNHVLSPSF